MRTRSAAKAAAAAKPGLATYLARFGGGGAHETAHTQRAHAAGARRATHD